jgi:propionyl-CoA synthetase
MGSAEEFKQMLQFVEKNKVLPIIDTVLEGIGNANKGFPLLADADKRSGGKVIVKIAEEGQESKL